MNKITNYFAFVMMLCIAVSCTKDETTPEPDPTNPDTRVVVVCEGAFGASSASISTYDKEEETVVPNAFELINGYGVGDVLQSISAIDNKLYAVVNNSAKIEVMDKSSLTAETPINGFSSPRYIAAAGEGKAYVSNLFTDMLDIVDLETKSITGTINVHGWTEGMLKVSNEMYVCRSNSDKVMVIDVTTDLLVDSIEVTSGPVNMVQDEEGMIWVLSNGNFGQVTPTIKRIDPNTKTVTGTFELPAPHSYQLVLRINPAADQLYILNNEVYTMFIGDTEIDSTPLIDNGNSNYGLAIDPDNGEIYVGYAPDFSSDGIVFRYSASGVALDNFNVGIAPNSFYFGD